MLGPLEVCDLRRPADLEVAQGNVGVPGLAGWRVRYVGRRCPRPWRPRPAGPTSPARPGTPDPWSPGRRPRTWRPRDRADRPAAPTTAAYSVGSPTAAHKVSSNSAETASGRNGRRSRVASFGGGDLLPDGLVGRLASVDADAGQQVGPRRVGQPFGRGPPARRRQSQAGQVQRATARDQQRPAICVRGRELPPAVGPQLQRVRREHEPPWLRVVDRRRPDGERDNPFDFIDRRLGGFVDLGLERHLGLPVRLSTTLSAPVSPARANTS